MNDATPFKIRYELHQEDGIFIAHCLDLDVTSDGDSEAEALENLREAIELYAERHAEALVIAAEKQARESEE